MTEEKKYPRRLKPGERWKTGYRKTAGKFHRPYGRCVYGYSKTVVKSTIVPGR